jgi:hypothetical protein
MRVIELLAARIIQLHCAERAARSKLAGLLRSLGDELLGERPHGALQCLVGRVLRTGRVLDALLNSFIFQKNKHFCEKQVSKIIFTTTTTTTNNNNIIITII